MGVEVVVRDIHRMKRNKEIIGYCVCGREVKYTPTHIDRNEYSIQSKVYVSEAIMSQDSSGFTMYPTFKEIT